MNPIVDKNGIQYWYKDDDLHREDGPAVIHADGSQCWYMNDKLHREGEPAIIYADGTQHWYRNGKLHREDGPAIIYSEGNQYWYRNGKRHREDGPAVSIGIYEMWYEKHKFKKSNSMDFDVDHYLTNDVPQIFLRNVNYEVYNMIISITDYRKLPSNTVYKNCVINFSVYDDARFIDCVFAMTTP